MLLCSCFRSCDLGNYRASRYQIYCFHVFVYVRTNPLLRVCVWPSVFATRLQHFSTQGTDFWELLVHASQWAIYGLQASAWLIVNHK